MISRVEQELNVFVEQSKRYRGHPDPLQQVYQALAEEGITEQDRDDLLSYLGPATMRAVQQTLDEGSRSSDEASLERAVEALAARIAANLLRAYVVGYRIGRSQP